MPIGFDGDHASTLERIVDEEGLSQRLLGSKPLYKLLEIPWRSV